MIGFATLYILLAFFGVAAGYAGSKYLAKHGVQPRPKLGVSGLLALGAGIVAGICGGMGLYYIYDRPFSECYGAFVRAVTFFSCLGIGQEVAAHLKRRERLSESEESIVCRKAH